MSPKPNPRTSAMKPDRVSEAVALIGKPWDTCLDERCRNAARRHMALLASVSPDETPAWLAVQGLLAIGIVARTTRTLDIDRPGLVVPSDQWAKAYA